MSYLLGILVLWFLVRYAMSNDSGCEGKDCRACGDGGVHRP